MMKTPKFKTISGLIVCECGATLSAHENNAMVIAAWGSAHHKFCYVCQDDAVTWPNGLAGYCKTHDPMSLLTK